MQFLLGFMEKIPTSETLNNRTLLQPYISNLLFDRQSLDLSISTLVDLPKVLYTS